MLQPRAIPVSPRSRELPFYAPEFTWETFEALFCDFLASRPKLRGKDGKLRVVAQSHPFGHRGDSQHGIDIGAQMDNEEVWVFQCKHYEKWLPSDTKKAVQKCTYEADRKFLLVTRKVSAKSRTIIASRPDWELWDSTDISREFFASLEPHDAARLLYTYFGPEWPREMLGVAGTTSLLSTQAKFEPFLRESRTFHHRLKLIGRATSLRSLDDFAEHASCRVYCLIGRGGIGKSKLLREWGTEFSTRHKNCSLRFVGDTVIDLGQMLDSYRHPLVIVLDDAHRLDEIRRIVAGESFRRKHVKIVLSLRPGPLSQVQSELTRAGFDLSEIQEVALKPLSAKRALELVDAALGPEFAQQFRIQVRALTQDCPLMTLIAAELIKKGTLKETHLLDTREFQQLIFQELLNEVKPVEERFGSVIVQDLLRLLSLLSPVQADRTFLQNAASFLGSDIPEDRVAQLLSELEKTGILLLTGGQVRIVPDLLSDHLAYTACYNAQRVSTTFAERVLRHFSPSEFPRLFYQLAEAEWRALGTVHNPDSVVEPLWQWFLERFKTGNYYDRCNLIRGWTNIAHLQPKRSIELIEIATALEASNSAETEAFSASEVFDAIIPLIKTVAVSHPPSTVRCINTLWTLGRNKPINIPHLETHPISQIGAVAKFELEKSIEVSRAVIAWLCELTANDDWKKYRNPPRWILPEILSGLFSSSVDRNWMTGMTLHCQSLPIHIANTNGVRDAALELCSKLLLKKSPDIALGVLAVIKHAICAPHFRFREPPTGFTEAWNAQRLKGVALLEVAAKTFSDDPFILHDLRVNLWDLVRYKHNQEIREECKRVFSMIPDFLELRIVRTLVGHYMLEFETWDDNRQSARDHANRRWNALLHRTAEEIYDRFGVENALKAIAPLHERVVELGKHSYPGQLLEAMGKADREKAVKIAEQLLSNSEPNTLPGIQWLILAATKGQSALRSSICERLLNSGRAEMMACAIDTLAAWRREGDCANWASERICHLAESASPPILNSILGFVRSRPEAADWEILRRTHISPKNPQEVSEHADAAHALLEAHHYPAPEVVSQILKVYENVESLEAFNIEELLNALAQKFPGKVLKLLHSRIRSREIRSGRFDSLPFELRRLQFSKVECDIDWIVTLTVLEDAVLRQNEFDHLGKRLLQMALTQSDIEPEKSFLEILEMISTAEELRRVTDLFADNGAYPGVLRSPPVTREILLKARALGLDVHKTIFQELRRIPGGRGWVGTNPDEETRNILNQLDELKRAFVADTELGPLYLKIKSDEESWSQRMCDDARTREEMYSDGGED